MEGEIIIMYRRLFTLNYVNGFMNYGFSFNWDN